LDFGLAVHEHDLIALLTARVYLVISSLNKLTPREGDRGRMSRLVDIMPWNYTSTSPPHPLAKEPFIFISSISLILGHCNVLIKIVGEFLALLITFPLVRDASVDMFFLLRWKKGEAHCVGLS
jgi:hypothetical protein